MVTVAYELKECTDAAARPQVRASRTVTVAPTTQPDDNERFYIPYASLRNWFKDTNITVESYDNQTLKSVAGTITDKSGDAITSIVSSAIKLATIGAGVAPAAAAAVPRPPRCNPIAVAALKALKDLKARDKPTEQETAAIADLRSQLTHKEVVYWSPAKPNPVPDQRQSPLTLAVTISPAGLVGGHGKWVTGDAAALDSLTTMVQLTVNETVTADAATPPSGFLLRQGPSAILRVCEQACPIPTVDAMGAFRTDETQVLNTSVHVVPQLGNYTGHAAQESHVREQQLAPGSRSCCAETSEASVWAVTSHGRCSPPIIGRCARWTATSSTDISAIAHCRSITRRARARRSTNTMS